VTPEEVVDGRYHGQQQQLFEEKAISPSKPPTMLLTKSAALPAYNSPSVVPVLSGTIIICCLLNLALFQSGNFKNNILKYFFTGQPQMVYIQYIPMQSMSARSFLPTMATMATSQYQLDTSAIIKHTKLADDKNVPLSQIFNTKPKKTRERDSIAKISMHNARAAVQNVVENEGGVGVEKPYKCVDCGVGFQWLSHLNRHKKTHSNEKYMCNVCHAGFSQLSYFNAHRRTHFAEKPYKCDKCKKGFVQSTHLKIHKMIHTGEKPYQCYICKARFTQHGNLKRHIRTHTGEKPFKCTVCPARFTHSSDLTRHLRIHTGEKPYRCHHCGTGFATNGNLKSHLKIHTSGKSFKCTVCKASFNLESYLRSHMRTHTGERPFVCACGQSFTQGLSFKFHLRAKMTTYCQQIE